jgi:hypothetical protein
MKLSSRLAELDAIFEEIEKLTLPHCKSLNPDFCLMSCRVNNIAHEGRKALYRIGCSIEPEGLDTPDGWDEYAARRKELEEKGLS